jgi:hypothetical protein
MTNGQRKRPLIGHLSFVIGHFRRRGTRSRDTTIVAGRVVYSDDPAPHLINPRHRSQFFHSSDRSPALLFALREDLALNSLIFDYYIMIVGSKVLEILDLAARPAHLHLFGFFK